MTHVRVKTLVIFLSVAGLFLLAYNQSAGGPATPKKTYTAEELRNLDVGPTCMTPDCHADLKKVRFRHGPTAQDKCDPCHAPVGGKHVFTLLAKGNELCLECHDPVPQRKFPHEPVREDCLRCHAIHGADNRFFLQEGEGSAICMKCHDDVSSGITFAHGPFAQGLCRACHEPHESANEHLLIAPKEEFCTICHEEIGEDSKTAVVIHEPFEKDCNGCHSAHGSKARYFLHKPADSLCNECHEEDVEKARNAKHPHKAVTEEERCASCHAPHYSNFEKLLKHESLPLCLSCHDRKYTRDNGKEMANIKIQVEGAGFVHGPIRDKTCIPCHNAHGSENIRLLNHYFPPRFYAPFKEENYALCFDCHDKKVVYEADSRDTDFRNGLQNLHFLHVNREKGRTCRACHAEHASHNPVHIRPSVPFGKWIMEIAYDKTETGGSCATGCHARYAYDRRKPVKNAVPAE